MTQQLENRIFHGDCLVMMNCLDNESVDMILCDLPYGVTSRNRWDSIIPFDPLWAHYRRVIKPNGAIVLTGMGLFSARLMLSAADLYKYTIIWVKNQATGFLNAQIQPLRCHEDVLVFYKKQPTYNPQKTTGHKPGRYGNNKTTLNYGHFSESGFNSIYAGSTERLPRTVINIPVVSGGARIKAHPTQKPVELAEYLVATYTNPGDLVLDNACGSGALLKGAKNLGRRYVGFEKEEGYFNHATEWLSQ